MSDKKRLLGLAERCEKATEHEQRTLLSEVGDAVVLTMAFSYDWQVKWLGFLDAGAFLDAAMTLVPKGCSWRVGVSTEPRKALLGGSAAEVMQGCFGKCLAQTGGDTPALALTAAALRARAAMVGEPS